MAKDPAFLFYPGDWLGGTLGMTFEQKGAYMEVLMLQFNRGHMTIHMIEHILGHSFGQIWEIIQTKFVVDNEGLYYNVRLEEEKEKRINYTNSRKNNKLGSNQHTKKVENKVGHMTKHMSSHMEDENINKNIDNKKDEKLKNQNSVDEDIFDEPKVSIADITKYKVMPYITFPDEFKKMYSESLYADYQWFVKYIFDPQNEVLNVLQSEYQVTPFQFKKILSKFTREQIIEGLDLLTTKEIGKDFRIAKKIKEYTGYHIRNSGKNSVNGHKSGANEAVYTAVPDGNLKGQKRLMNTSSKNTTVSTVAPPST